ncbi:hypothetical protein [Sphaerisporangium corydalis]|uniref:Uncharacterized protein n=1 Tax=Sphaerisporangium corydalis TaxID=1441875 RepID=A0ABV9EFP4_9ACTN|nr:hypothetical protein [Sphaerisporangium corydalis]
MDRPLAPGSFACPGCGAVSRLAPMGRALAGTGPGAASWEMWLRGRGEEVTAMVRVGKRVTERNGTGDVDVAAMLTDAWRAATT